MKPASEPLRRLLDMWRRDIVLRLAVSVFLAVLLSTAAYTTYAVLTLHASAERQLQERSERLATVLTQALARPLFDINGAAITSVVEAMRGTPEVLDLRVRAPNGAELAGFTAAAAGRGGAHDAIAVHREISFQDGARRYLVGALDLAYSRREADEELRRQLRHALAVNLLLALTIVGAIFSVARKVARPFADIQHALEELSQGRTNIALSGIGRADQVGRLSAAVRSFRDTLMRLRDAERELRELNGDLEQKIDARTAALKQAVQVARDSETKLLAIVDTALDAVVTLDGAGRIVGWNRQAEAIFGHARETVLGQPLDMLVIGPRGQGGGAAGMAGYLAAAGTGAPPDRRIEVAARRADGSALPIELAITRIDLGGDDVAFCAFIRAVAGHERRSGDGIDRHET
ncbi:PAS domain S-box-containing protein [Pseudoduganella lurida]|uniref:PAS domain S-box-containing protein n=1 Tax=Pseudoduganella lurida TaxID=1036180 RepID=A0A562RLR6_9BURK|nr:PAS domain S-box protein [Pseudoduganella lurida]TWI69972.1 PAS domain S-box-containing protein [Pseudoduganella lurida]